MKKIAVLLFALCTFAVAAEAADDWVKIGGNPAGDFYLNLRSIEKQRDYVTGWVMVDFSDVAKSSPEMQRLRRLTGSEPSFSMVLFGAAKGTKQTRQFQSKLYDKNAIPILIISAQELEQMGGGQWQYCTPDTMEELVWYALMLAAGIRF